MAQRLNLFAVLVFVLGTFAPSAFATDYYWYLKAVSGPNFSTPSAACAQAEANITASYSNATLKSSGMAWVSQTEVSCQFTLQYTSGNMATFSKSQTILRAGDGCPSGTTYDASIQTGASQCRPPSDAECKVRSSYTKVIQFSAAEGAVVFSADPEIKDGCVYEPSLNFDNCTDTQCTVDMQPVGNTDMSDNADNPEQELQDYLDELAKDFKCEKTENGTVGCTNAEQTTPDIDPDDKCPDGYSWSGTACFPTSGNGNENPDGGGSSGGGSSSGGSDGGSSGGDSGGEGAGEGDGSSSGGGGGGNNDNGDDGTDDGLSNSLEEPKAGNWDGANSEWDERLEQAKAELKEKVRQNTEALKGVFDLNLGTGGGSLPCDSFTLFGRPMSLCFDSYTDTLAGMRNALLLVASVIAAFVILKD